MDECKRFFVRQIWPILHQFVNEIELQRFRSAVEKVVQGGKTIAEKLQLNVDYAGTKPSSEETSGAPNKGITLSDNSDDECDVVEKEVSVEKKEPDVAGSAESTCREPTVKNIILRQASHKTMPNPTMARKRVGKVMAAKTTLRQDCEEPAGARVATKPANPHPPKYLTSEDKNIVYGIINLDIDPVHTTKGRRMWQDLIAKFNEEGNNVRFYMLQK